MALACRPFQTINGFVLPTTPVMTVTTLTPNGDISSRIVLERHVTTALEDVCDVRGR